MSENELTITGGNDLAILDLPPISAPAIAKEPSFSLLPYITVVQGLSPLAQPPHQVQPGNFALHTGKDDFEVLGKEFDVFLADMRYKATRWMDQKMTVTTDRESTMFREFGTNSDNGIDGYRWGFEFLLYVGSLGVYATLFCNNVSLRIAAKNYLVPRMRTVCTIKQDFIEGKKHKWWSLKSAECNEPLAIPIEKEQIIAQILRFQQETVSAIEDDPVVVVVEEDGR